VSVYSLWLISSHHIVTVVVLGLKLRLLVGWSQ